MKKRSLLLFASTTLLSYQVLADEPKKEGWSGDIELGYVSTEGNSQSKSMQGRIDTLWEVERWRNATHFEALNAEADDTRSAERYYLTNKVDHKLNERSYLFGFASYEDDRFTGYDYQAVAAGGYGYRILDSDTMTWDMETGPGYRYSKIAEDEVTDEEEEEELILRLYTKYQWKISDNATFEQELGSDVGQDKTMSRSVTSLKSTIVGALAMKLSYTIRYTDNVPADTQHADTETAVTLVYGF